jgi:hypothetical protein
MGQSKTYTEGSGGRDAVKANMVAGGISVKSGTENNFGFKTES